MDSPLTASRLTTLALFFIACVHRVATGDSPQNSRMYDSEVPHYVVLSALLSTDAEARMWSQRRFSPEDAAPEQLRFLIDDISRSVSRHCIDTTNDLLVYGERSAIASMVYDATAMRLATKGSKNLTLWLVEGLKIPSRRIREKAALYLLGFVLPTVESRKDELRAALGDLYVYDGAYQQDFQQHHMPPGLSTDRVVAMKDVSKTAYQLWLRWYLSMDQGPLNAIGETARQSLALKGSVGGCVANEAKRRLCSNPGVGDAEVHQLALLAFECAKRRDIDGALKASYDALAICRRACIEVEDRCLDLRLNIIDLHIGKGEYIKAEESGKDIIATLGDGEDRYSAIVWERLCSMYLKERRVADAEGAIHMAFVGHLKRLSDTDVMDLVRVLVQYSKTLVAGDRKTAASSVLRLVLRYYDVAGNIDPRDRESVERQLSALQEHE